MATPNVALDLTPEAPPSIHTEPRTCQWCQRHAATITDTSGAWCCELHREADQAGQPRPVWREVPANAIHDGFGGCVWCAQLLGSPDCCRKRPELPAGLPTIIFGGNR